MPLLLLDLTEPAGLPARADGNVGAEVEFVRFIDALAPEIPDLVDTELEPRVGGGAAFIAFMAFIAFIGTIGGGPEGRFLGGMIWSASMGSSNTKVVSMNGTR